MPTNSQTNSVTASPVQDDDKKSVPEMHVSDTTTCPEVNKKVMFAGPKINVTRETCKLSDEGSFSRCDDIGLSKDTLRVHVHDRSSSNLLQAKSSGPVGFSSSQQRAASGLSKQETHSLILLNKSQKEATTKEEEFLSSLLTPHHSQTKEGKGTFKDLYFPPLPPPDASLIMASLQPRRSLPHVTPTSSLLSSQLNILGSLPEDGTTSPRNTCTSQETKSSEKIPAPPDLPTKLPPSSPDHSALNIGSQSRKRLAGQESQTKFKMTNSKEKLLQATLTREKCCPTGTCIHIHAVMMC